jgi:hypothetical protein
MTAPRHTVSFQHYTPGAEAPRAGYEITDADFELPPSAHVPRVGEFVQIITGTSAESYEVLAITSRIFALDGQEPGWHAVITVGPVVGEQKEILSIVRE